MAGRRCGDSILSVGSIFPAFCTGRPLFPSGPGQALWAGYALPDGRALRSLFASWADETLRPLFSPETGRPLLSLGASFPPGCLVDREAPEGRAAPAGIGCSRRNRMNCSRRNYFYCNWKNSFFIPIRLWYSIL